MAWRGEGGGGQVEGGGILLVEVELIHCSNTYMYLHLHLTRS